MKQINTLPSRTDSRYKSLFRVFLLSVILSACGGGGGDDGGDGNNNTTDTTAPVIILSGEATVNLNQGDLYNDAGATANDDTDGDISTDIVVGGDTVDTNTVGSYSITYNVSDAAGNAASEVSRTVHINSVVSQGITSFVAYTVRDLLANSETIYTVRGNGEDHQKMHPGIPVGGAISMYSWAPLGGRMAYLGDVDTDAVNELYSLLPDQNLRVKLNGTLTSGGNVVEYQWSPDGSRVAYRANQDDFGKIELYVVDSDGQNRMKVNTALTGGGNVEEFSWSPTGNHLMYRADATVNDQFEWYVSSGTSTTANLVNINLTAGDSIEQVKWSPQGNYISYMTHPVSSTIGDLYVYEISTESNTKMDTTELFYSSDDYEWSNSENALVVRAAPFSFTLEEVFIFPVNNSTTVTIIPAITAGNYITAAKFVPGQERLILVIKREGIMIYEVNGNLVNQESSGDFESPKFIFSHNTQQVLVQETFGSSGVKSPLYSYDLSFSTPAVQLIDVSNIAQLSWSQDSTRILINSLTRNTLISPNGSGIVELDTSTSSTTYNEQWIGNDIYLTGTDVSGSGVDEIIKLDYIGSNLVTLASSDTTHFFPGDNTFISSSDDSFLVYHKAGNVGQVGELHVVNPDGTTDVKINMDLTIGLIIEEFSIQPIN